MTNEELQSRIAQLSDNLEAWPSRQELAVALTELLTLRKLSTEMYGCLGYQSACPRRRFDALAARFDALRKEWEP